MGTSTDQQLPNLSLPVSGGNDTNDATWEAVNLKDGELYSIHEDDRVSSNIANQPHFNLAHRDVIVQEALNPVVNRLNEDHIALWEYIEGRKVVSVSANDTGLYQANVYGKYLEDKVIASSGYIDLVVDNEGGDEKLKFTIGQNVLTRNGGYNGSTFDWLADGTTYRKLKYVDLNNEATTQSYKEASITPLKLIADVAAGSGVVDSWNPGLNSYYGVNQNGSLGWHNIFDSNGPASTFWTDSKSNLPDTDASWNIGSTIKRIATVHAVNLEGTASTALYADLAELYLVNPDENIEIGSVVIISEEDAGYECELSKEYGQESVLGIVANKPAYTMNSGIRDEDNAKPIALKGRVKATVIGPIKAGEALITAPGGKAIGLRNALAQGLIDQNDAISGITIAKARQNVEDETENIIEVAVI